MPPSGPGPRSASKGTRRGGTGSGAIVPAGSRLTSVQFPVAPLRTLHRMRPWKAATGVVPSTVAIGGGGACAPATAGASRAAVSSANAVATSVLMVGKTARRCEKSRVTSNVGAALSLHAHRSRLVPPFLRGAHARPGTGVAGDRGRRARPHLGAHGQRQDPRRLPVGARPPLARARRPHPPGLRLAAQGAQLRRRPQPARAAARDRRRPHRRGAHGRHARSATASPCGARRPTSSSRRPSRCT